MNVNVELDYLCIRFSAGEKVAYFTGDLVFPLSAISSINQSDRATSSWGHELVPGEGAARGMFIPGLTRGGRFYDFRLKSWQFVVLEAGQVPLIVELVGQRFTRLIFGDLPNVGSLVNAVIRP